MLLISESQLPINEGGQSPGARKVLDAPKYVIFLCWHIAHIILISATKWPQKSICFVQKVKLLVFAWTGGRVWYMSALFSRPNKLVRAKGPSLKMSKGPGWFLMTLLIIFC